MACRVLLKNSVKHAAGLASVATSFLSTRTRSGACVLMYHRVADTGTLGASADNWNISPSRLEAHFRWLATNAECVPLAQVLQKCRSRSGPKPLAVLTFDDGFSNFRHNVLPLLERYRIPATLFVVTRYVGSEKPYPFDRWAQMSQLRVPLLAWRPISWAEIEECLRSGLVAVGSHSHSHLNAKNVPDEQLAEEAMISREILKKRLGNNAAPIYAYPYGSSRLGHVRPAYIEAVRAAGYMMAVTTDLGLVNTNSSQFQVPRVEAHGLDSPRILKAKIFGGLWPLRLWDRFRQAQRDSN